MKAQHTNKLFFNKYLYKATVYCPRIAFIRYPKDKVFSALTKSENFNEFLAKGGNTLKNRWDQTRPKDMWENRFTIYKIMQMREKLYSQNTEFTMRLETSHCGFYLNDKDLFDDICKQFKDIVVDISWPTDEKHGTYLLNNPTHEIVNNYPHGKYRYRINLRNKFLSSDVRQGFKDWIKNYPDLEITDITLNSIKNGGYDLNGKFLYSTNKDIMLLLQMYLSDAVKSITEFKLRKEL